MSHRNASRRWLLRTALQYLGTPYIWGGDDPSGFDCSGFVGECLKAAGLLGEREDLSADGLMKRFSAHSVETPRSGALLFALNKTGQATHVVMCLDERFQIGASGGTHLTADPAAAWRDNAYVKIRPIVMSAGKYRIADPFCEAVAEQTESARSHHPPGGG